MSQSLVMRICQEIKGSRVVHKIEMHLCKEWIESGPQRVANKVQTFTPDWAEKDMIRHCKCDRE